MRTARLEALSQEEVERIHAAPMEVLSTVGVKLAGPHAYRLMSDRE